MNWFFDDNDWTDIALKIIGVILTIITFRWLKNIFSGSDGKKGFSQQDLLKMTAFILFTWASVYLIVVEAHREDLSHQVYGEGYLFLVFGGLLFVLGMDSVLDKILEILTKLIELRKSKPKSEE